MAIWKAINWHFKKHLAPLSTFAVSDIPINYRVKNNSPSILCLGLSSISQLSDRFNQRDFASFGLIKIGLRTAQGCP
jgi:hypothetical protein